MIFFRNYTACLSCLLTLAVFLAFQAFAQVKQYEWSAKKDIPLLSVGAAGTLTSLLLRSQNEALSLHQVNTLDKERLSAWGQAATKNYSPSLQRASDILLTASYAFPLGTLLIPEARQDIGMISVMLVEGILLNEMLTGITKNLVNRPRPFAYNPDLGNEIRTESGNNLSFISGHTSYTAMFSFFTARVLNSYLENATTRTIVWTGAVLWPALTGYFRYEGGKHFIGDVLVGYTVGAAVGYFIPRLHKTKKDATSPKGFHLDLNSTQPFRLVFAF